MVLKSTMWKETCIKTTPLTMKKGELNNGSKTDHYKNNHCYKNHNTKIIINTKVIRFR